MFIINWSKIIFIFLTLGLGDSCLSETSHSPFNSAFSDWFAPHTQNISLRGAV